MFERPLTLIVMTLVLCTPPAAGAQSAPDAGAPFEPQPLSEPHYDIGPPISARIHAADGNELHADVWLPVAKPGGPQPPSKLPVILNVTHYEPPASPGTPRAMGHLVPRGYAYVGAHARGTGESDGCLDYLGAIEMADLGTFLTHAGTAEFSNGSVAMIGTSNHGGSAVGAATLAARGREYLRAIVAVGAASTQYEFSHMDGVPFVGTAAGDAAYMAYHTHANTQPGPRHADRLPCTAPRLTGQVVEADGGVTPWLAERDLRRGAETVTAATLLVQGFYDTRVAPLTQVGLFDQLPEGTPRFGIFGVFDHETPDAHESGLRPEWERTDYLPLVTAWLDRWVKGLPTGADRWPTAHVQASDGQWRAEPDWPAGAGRKARLALGPRTLGARRPSGSSSYTEAGLELSHTARGDMARFDTPPLEAPLHLAGMPVLDAWVILDRPDAHIAAELEVIGPDGEPLELARTFGARSARHLDPFVDGRFVQADGRNPATGEPLRVSVRFQPTDLVVPAGHRLRLTLSGSVEATDGLGEAVEVAGGPAKADTVVNGPTQPSGALTRVTVLHDCPHASVLRFRLAGGDEIDVREADQAGPLGRVGKKRIGRRDGGGIASRRVCGK